MPQDTDAQKQSHILITGATGPVGTAIVRRLIDAGHSLILCGPDSEMMDALTHELSVSPQQHVQSIIEDLSLPGGGARLYNALKTGGTTVNTLIHCPRKMRHPAFSETQRKSTAFAESELLLERALIHREILAVTELIKFIGIDMLRARKGHMLLVTLSGRSGAVARGAQAYVRAICGELDREWKPGGVRVSWIVIQGEDPDDTLAAQRAARDVLKALRGADRRGGLVDRILGR